MPTDQKGAALTGTTRIAGVMGWPVSHSLSPQLHGYWLRILGINGAYIPLPVRPDDLGSALRALPKLGFAGVNVTVPHKEAALQYMHCLSETAGRIGAVNTVTVAPDGSLKGDSSDGYGFVASLRHQCPDWQPAAGPVIMLGAGGSARAIGDALINAGVLDLVLINRGRDRAEALAENLGPIAKVVAWEDRGDALADAALLVNATTLGMTGQAPLELDLDALPTTAIVYDIVYSPINTKLLRSAAARGNRTVDGLGMLMHQGLLGFASWFGATPRVTDDLRAFLLAHLR